MELDKHTPDVLKIVPDKSILPELYGRRIGFSKPTYPGFYHVHHIHDYSVQYMDPETCKEFNASLEEIKALGPGFQQLVTHPEDIARVNQLLSDLAKNRSEDETLTYFQRIKLRTIQREDYTLILTSVKLNLENNTFCCISNTTDQLPVFTKKICNALNSQYEIKALVNIFMQLTTREKEIYNLLLQNKSAKEIASIINRSQHTIEQHKKNIYKKFNIKSLSELVSISHKLAH